MVSIGQSWDHADIHDDLRAKYLETYWIDREVSSANRSGTVRHSIKRIKCPPRISHYPKLQGLVHGFEKRGDKRGLACILHEVDKYVTAMPGTATRPEFMRHGDSSGDIIWVRHDEKQPEETLDVEHHVLQCLLVKVIKCESAASAGAVKVEADP